ncbi:1-acyl-sn-glycerol-3-phosphate acyltransferase [Lachnospiraceae bacterium MD1]|jgi:1-acyl-sn-glycerol-3-phosphate acyltransferase|uniref:1-acyl-sn-glycerol-3-phosphate acyltransferase n=1 Tax=Variimorphobacter saccharofermentans TaxID=2755051 RepID=A0A839JV53_9FIRM|nr:lysophospholipid acyltransferase family protein [Variimorphobacter saccharofermentans]MBB2181523.1 1-acyl-sn-glycerol-3-phosphate acyltransferase [Variimorphobacter saccharofermentans]
MKRIALMVLRSLFNLPFWFFRIFQLCNIKKYDAATRYAYLHRLVPIVNRRGRIKIECHGIENLPKENGYIMFPNHQGLFDALAFLETHERPFVTVMKKEVKDTILLKQIIQILQAEVIDREDIRQSMQVIMNMTRRVKEGENFIIFAEGTRSRNGNQLLEFKGGSFKSAMNAKCPIVPVALVDSFKAFDTNSIKKQTVQIHYMEPLYYDDYKGMKSTEVAELVASRIQQKVNENIR